MNESDLLNFVAEVGLESHSSMDSWTKSLRLLSVLDAIGRDGGGAIIKIDAGRNDGRVYTVVVSGGRLGSEFFRGDGSDLHALLFEAIRFWVAQVQR